MSLSEKKAWKLSFSIYVYGDYNYLTRIQSRILRYIEKTISQKKLVEVTHSFTDRVVI